MEQVHVHNGKLQECVSRRHAACSVTILVIQVEILTMGQHNTEKTINMYLFK